MIWKQVWAENLKIPKKVKSKLCRKKFKVEWCLRLQWWPCLQPPSPKSVSRSTRSSAIGIKINRRSTSRKTAKAPRHLWVRSATTAISRNRRSSTHRMPTFNARWDWASTRKWSCTTDTKDRWVRRRFPATPTWLNNNRETCITEYRSRKTTCRSGRCRPKCRRERTSQPTTQSTDGRDLHPRLFHRRSKPRKARSSCPAFRRISCDRRRSVHHRTRCRRATHQKWWPARTIFFGWSLSSCCQPSSAVRLPTWSPATAPSAPTQPEYPARQLSPVSVAAEPARSDISTPVSWKWVKFRELFYARLLNRRTRIAF